MILVLLAALAVGTASPDVQTILQRSMQATIHDWQEQPNFSCTETDRDASGNTKTYQDLMIDGSEYDRLVALNGKPLPEDREREQQRKLQAATEKRNGESADERQKRIEKYETERRRDHALALEIPKTFNFRLVGQQRLDGHTAYVLEAAPKPGYHPNSKETEVLTGMQGRLWIDTRTYQWLKVEADTVRSVSIDGFLARVEPGTKFELEKMPVGIPKNDVWLPKHFTMTAHTKILGLLSKDDFEDDTFSNCHR